MFKLFSERNKKITDEVDVYLYDNIPAAFRNQLFFIIRDLIKDLETYQSNLWEAIHDAFCREKGLKDMDECYNYYSAKIEQYIDHSSDTDLLDFIDFIFHFLDYLTQEILSCMSFANVDSVLTEAINELNERFQQHRLGYELIDDVLVRIDNTFIHREYIKPAINLLHNNGFTGAEEEYVKAFEALRNGDNKNAIVEAEKSFESTMKTICIKRGFPFNPSKSNAKDLISILRANDYFQGFMEDHLNTVIKALENGAPTVRNKTSGHGQGEAIVTLPNSYAEYVIGLVAVNIVFLVKML